MENKTSGLEPTVDINHSFCTDTNRILLKIKHTDAGTITIPTFLPEKNKDREDPPNSLKRRSHE